jgi:hypothetical protein
MSACRRIAFALQAHEVRSRQGIIMTRKILLARPRLDCSFKQGPVPDVVGPPLNPILCEFGRFLDQMQAFHEARGDTVVVDERPLWRFELSELQVRAADFDRVYFPHKLRQQFPIGPNAWFYKNAPLAGFMTVDPAGWGASLSFLPPPVSPSEIADQRYAVLRERISRNESIFTQPAVTGPPVAGEYDLFLCQLPHDETIQFHSRVGVSEALAAVLVHCRNVGRRLVVKGHPANPKSMEPLRMLISAYPEVVWVDDLSIHACIAGAACVFTVNSGSGMEVLLHDRPLIRFGRAEYDAVVDQAAIGDVAQARGRTSSTRERAAFIHAYLSRCLVIDEPKSFEIVLT